MSLPESPASAPSRALSPRLKRGLVLFVCALSLAAGVVFLRGFLLERATERALAALLAFDALKRSSEEIPESPGPSIETEDTELEPAEILFEEGKPTSKRARTPDTISVPPATVLAWIRGRKVPRGRAVGASPWLPAGISVQGISRYGLGLVESDRLVAVDGAPVADPSAVISAVLGALGRGASQITGSFVRATQSGPRTIRLIVHFPDAEEIQGVLDGLEDTR